MTRPINTTVCAGCNKDDAEPRPRPDFELPLCDACYHVRTQRLHERPTPLTGVARNVYGVTTEGKRGDGATSWEFRPPVPWQDAHHSDPLEIGGRVQYQQAPPVHVGGSPPTSAKERKRIVRAITEEEAARRSLALELQRVPRATVAAVIGVTPRKLRRKIERHNCERKASARTRR